MNSMVTWKNTRRGAENSTSRLARPGEVTAGGREGGATRAASRHHPRSNPLAQLPRLCGSARMLKPVSVAEPALTYGVEKPGREVIDISELQD